ncbi:MAG TPA: DUF4139 domain-containing protein [Methylomirabilota bacterium]|jgi:hypothetical protein|nr:DUF4139 domain-containing protein [Methylomirabilota bacterium]
MRHRLSAALLALTLLSPGGPAAAAPPLAITRESQRDLMVTIYNGNLGLVKDTREVRLPAGMSEVQFADVAAQIDPTSVHLKSLSDPAGLRILEQNYEYDLLSAQKLLEKYVGKKVRLYQGSASYVEATLLSTDGPVYDINGEIHMGHHGQVVFPSLPENLVSKPTLMWLLRNGSTAPQRVEASYLTGGISWKADYVVILNAADDRADLTGWVTVDNKSGATYRDAALKLVAGDVNRARDDRTRQAMELAAKSAAAAPASRDFVSEGFFEYHLYTLDGRTTIKDKQTKQLTLMTAAGVPVRKELAFFGARDYYRTQYGTPMSNQKVSVFVELSNTKANNLGVPLPKGKIRVYKADRSGSQQLVGEDWIDHTPKDERVRIKMGEAFDVVGERIQRDWRKIGGSTYEVEWEINLRNHKKENVVVSVIEPVPGDWEVLRESQPHEKVEAHTLRYQVPVPQEGAARVTYRVRLRF